MRRTETRRLIRIDRARLYQTFLDPVLLPRWKIPDGMTLTVHDYEPREGGRLRISLTYTDSTSSGKTTAHTDTYCGRFVRLVRDELIVVWHLAELIVHRGAAVADRHELNRHRHSAVLRNGEPVRGPGPA